MPRNRCRFREMHVKNGLNRELMLTADVYRTKVGRHAQDTWKPPPHIYWQRLLARIYLIRLQND